MRTLKLAAAILLYKTLSFLGLKGLANKLDAAMQKSGLG